MSAVITQARRPTEGRAPRASRAGVRAVYAVEVRKLAAQMIPRVVLGICLLGPFAFVLVMKTQTTLPADTLFGRWLHSSGFSVTFFVLGLASEWGFLVLVSLVAGDIFASEDRYGTWQSVLTRGRTRADVFAGKALAAATYSVGVVAVLLVTTLVAGVLLTGTQPLVSLSGTLLGSGRATEVAVAAWAMAIPPVLGFTALGILLSVATRSGIAGVVGTALVGFLMALLSLLGFRTLMLTTSFEAWHGVVTARPQLSPFLVGLAVSVAYAAALTALAWSLFRRRDVAGEARAVRRANQAVRVRIGVIAVAAVAVLAAASYRSSPITSFRLERDVSGTFRNLVDTKRALIGRPVTIDRKVLGRGRSLPVLAQCRRGGQFLPSTGPGGDWLCALAIARPAQPQIPVFYEINIKANGCYTADASASVVGPLVIPTATHRRVVNPLYAFDGCLVFS